MADIASTAPGQAPAAPRLSLRGALSAAEVDFRLFGMLIALAAILIGFNVANGGTFLRAEDMTALAVQGAGVAGSRPGRGAGAFGRITTHLPLVPVGPLLTS